MCNISRVGLDRTIRTGQRLNLHKGRSTHPTAGSFLRWTVPRDEPRSFLNALRSKYAPDQPLQHISDATGLAQSVPAQSIWISGKEIEEIGYDKISQQQAQLQNLRTIILDQSLVSSRTDDETRATNSGVRIACPKVQDLDLSHNLFENLDEIAEICKDLPRLTTLTLECVLLLPIIAVARRLTLCSVATDLRDRSLPQLLHTHPCSAISPR